MRRIRYLRVRQSSGASPRRGPDPRAGARLNSWCDRSHRRNVPVGAKVRGEGDRHRYPESSAGRSPGGWSPSVPRVAGFAVGDRVTSLTFTGSLRRLVLAPPHGEPHTRRRQLHASCRAGPQRTRRARRAVTAGRPQPSPYSSPVRPAAWDTSRSNWRKSTESKRVVAAVSSPDKADFLRGLGADEVVVYDSNTGAIQSTWCSTASAASCCPARSQRCDPADS